MFVTPMISVADFDRKQAQYSAARKAAQRASSSSSEGSSLHRTSSTTSNNSHSRWSTSSISSNDARVLTQPNGKLRKGQPRVSFHLPRPLQPFHKKALSQPQAQLPPASPRSIPPPRPPRPAEPFVFPRPSVDRRTTDEPESDSSAEISPPIQSTAPVLPPIRTDSLPWQCSDLVVRCKQDVYHVDRTIMCYHSKWFARVCAIMKTPKASKSVIDLSHDDSSAVAAMMQYCYQLDYFDVASDHDNAVDEVASLRPHVDIYMLAERYGMSGLKRCALDKFEDAAITVLKVSGDEEQFLTAVKTMYDPSRRANADEMRSVAVRICADHVEGFISGDYETMAMVFESMDNLPEFRSELFEEMARRWK